MAKVKKDNSDSSKPKKPRKLNKQQKFLLGILIILISLAVLLSFISYLYTGSFDQSEVSQLTDRNEKVSNWLGKIGASISELFIFDGFGVGSFLFIRVLFLAGLYWILDLGWGKLKKTFFWDLFAILLVAITFGFFNKSNPILGGTVGYELNLFLQDYIGKIGVGLLLLLGFSIFAIFRFNFTVEQISLWFTKTKKTLTEDVKNEFNEAKTISTDLEAEEKEKEEIALEKKEKLFEIREDEEAISKIELKPTSSFEINKEDLKPTIAMSSTPQLKKEEPITKPEPSLVEEKETTTLESEFVIETTIEEETFEENLSAKLVQDFGEFDPTLDLSSFKMPTLDLLKEYSSGGITVDQAELEENKNRIVDTLKNYNIGISSIKATVGPTVTLYEIVPEAGIRISKIKNLEDDIALSLAALGIRIIAPIPGKGTIGIEVPNNKPTMVSMKSVIASPKFQQAEMELPIALGKNISNETFVVDLAKMPHLLMAGATGQGKSVGLNAILTSLLYSKHPAEVKFVLVDPKKVELTLFNKIERHYLAKLPDTEDAIITDNSKVINTLNSLCIEMDNRYDLLKDAMVRNLKEYNEKFRNRKLNPENGHRFLPYIVLVVDEFADLIMTAGKEVETPIARLAQLARAIGIHLIIATQRPSVNVITGMIKANFPARIAFRVTSKIDSRTILDSGGADQLIGRGDMLFTQGNDLVRVQCAFVDTPEVEKITDYIGNQKAYPDAYLLPEYVGEESGIKLDNDISERDTLFREAAEVIVTAQQGSASLIQRKLKLGYNRAGRIIDQLEAAGIVGGFEGSKARSVLIPDLVALDDFLNNE